MFDVLNTDRLRLRPIREDDAAIIFEKWAQDAVITKYLTWKPHTTIETTMAFIDSCLAGWKSGHYTWLIEEITTRDVVGCFDATCEANESHKLTIGYLVAKSHWGNGYMSEIVQSFITEAFRNDEILRVSAVCDIDNVASKRVMEKSGMHYEGVLQSWMMHPNISTEPRDCHSFYAIKNV
jgi:RimJ/RimL family protein N-acetyltransferase